MRDMLDVKYAGNCAPFMCQSPGPVGEPIGSWTVDASPVFAVSSTTSPQGSAALSQMRQPCAERFHLRPQDRDLMFQTCDPLPV